MFSVVGAVATAFFHGFLEILSLLRYDYQGLFILAEGANLLALRRDVILLERAISKTLAVEYSGEKSFLLSFLSFFFFFHDGGVGLLSISFIGSVRHVDGEDVDGVMVRRRRDEA